MGASPALPLLPLPLPSVLLVLLVNLLLLCLQVLLLLACHGGTGVLSPIILLQYMQRVSF